MVCSEDPAVNTQIVRCLTLVGSLGLDSARRGSFAVYEAHTLQKPDLLTDYLVPRHRPQLLAFRPFMVNGSWWYML